MHMKERQERLPVAESGDGATPEAPGERSAADPGVRISRLDNGLVVVSHAMPHLETVALGLWVAAGSREERPEEAGLAHFLEHMAFKGTRRRTARQIAEEIEGRGGDLNAATSTEHTGYTAHVLKEDWALALDIIADIVTDPVFDPDEMERERGVILQEIAAAHDDPADLVFEQAEATAFPGHPLGRPVLGLPETVSRLTPEDLRAFRNRNYLAGRMVLSAAGNIDHEALVEEAGRLLGSLPRGAGPDRRPPLFSPGEKTTPRPHLDQTHIVLCWPAPGYLDERIWAAQAASSILGSGMASRLFQELREARGLCYATYSYYSAWADAGLIYLYAATAPEKAKEAEELMRKLARGLAGGMSPAELERARAQARAGLVMSLESPQARAAQMARQMLSWRRVPPMAEFIARIEAVSGPDVQEEARRIFSGPPVVSKVTGGEGS
jgi:predicted Zn-dependent peptidase